MYKFAIEVCKTHLWLISMHIYVVIWINESYKLKMFVYSKTICSDYFLPGCWYHRQHVTHLYWYNVKFQHFLFIPRIHLYIFKKLPNPMDVLKFIYKRRYQYLVLMHLIVNSLEWEWESETKNTCWWCSFFKNCQGLER